MENFVDFVRLIQTSNGKSTLKLLPPCIWTEFPWQLQEIFLAITRDKLDMHDSYWKRGEIAANDVCFLKYALPKIEETENDRFWIKT